MSEPLRVERRDGVVTLTLHRPEVRNALDAALMAQLTTTLRSLAEDDTVQVVVLTGEGTAFCAGADLTWMRAMVDYSIEENIADSRGFEAMLAAACELPMPLVARVNGHALAGATGLLACADVVVAVNTARFGFTEVKLGLVPAMISAYLVPRIGPGAAHRFMLTGELFDAATAQRIGLVHEVCPPEQLDEVVATIVGGVVAGGSEAQRATKALLRTVARHPDPADTEQARLASIAHARVSDEAQRRMRAFFTDRGR